VLASKSRTQLSAGDGLEITTGGGGGWGPIGGNEA